MYRTLAAEDAENVTAVLANRQALRPEERCWLASRVAANPHAAGQGGASTPLSAGPMTASAAAAKLPVPQRSPGDLPLFSMNKAN